MSTKTCPRCGGSGQVDDPAEQGKKMRELRLAKKLSLKEVARRMNLTAAYISDMELGRRNWRAELVEKYNRAIGDPYAE